MISKFTIDKKINMKEQAVKVVGNTKITKTDRSLKLYFPILMSDIKFGKPKISTLGKIDTSIFLNDNTCKPKISKKIIKHQNYITGKLSSNSSVKGKSSTNKKNGNVSSKYIKHGTSLRAKFLNHKFSKIMANTDE